MTVMRVPYALAVYGKNEINAVTDVLKNPEKITIGQKTKEFERQISGMFGKKHGLMVNSGSSANLLALELLNLSVGSEVITPLLTFSTTLAPIIQKNLVPVFVDAELGAYLIDLKKIEAAITPKTKAIMVPSLIGNVPDLEKLKKITKKHNLYLVEDSCDTLGATFSGKPSGSYTDISTISFYASHIITGAGGGGMVCFNNDRWLEKGIVMRSWGRQSSLFGDHEQSEIFEKRFAYQLESKPYDAKFIFSEVGYNFQPLELSAAFALEQLKRFKKFTEIRQNNFKELVNFFKKYEKFFILPVQHKKVFTNWLAFPLTIKKEAPFTRLELVTYLEKNDIQTRPIFSGNILKQPGFKNITHRKIENDHPITDYITHQGFLIGCHHGLTAKHLNYMKKVFDKFLTSRIRN